MNRAIDNVLRQTFSHASWLPPAKAPRDVIEVLSEALGPSWSVHRETDCEGEVSIIILPLSDDTKPAFVLYEKEGVARMAVVAGDDWEGDQGFPSFQEAVAGIITEIERLSIGAQNAI